MIPRQRCRKAVYSSGRSELPIRLAGSRTKSGGPEMDPLAVNRWLGLREPDFKSTIPPACPGVGRRGFRL